MKLDSNLNFTRPLMFYLQTEAVFKTGLVLLTGGCLTETLFREIYSIIGTVLGEHS